MLENEDFVKFANENLICVVGHNDTGHAAEHEDAKGNKVPGCELYPGLTCEQHQQIMSEVSRGGDLPKIEIPNGVPNSWFVAPDGTAERLDGAAQQSAGKVQELAEELQKKSGKAISWKDYTKLQEGFDSSAKATESGDFKVALAALVAIDKKSSKMPESVKTRLKTAVEALNAKVLEAFETLKGESDLPKRDKEVRALRGKITAKVGTAALPALAEIDAWLKANPLPK